MKYMIRIHPLSSCQYFRQSGQLVVIVVLCLLLKVMSGAGTEDWERCRDWLAEASPVSARPVSQVTAAWELYSYLKDGTELCRIVGFLTKGKVPEEILYRTQNIR